MKKKRKERGTPIGSVLSQTIGNLSSSELDQMMKAFCGKGGGYFRYCDDVIGIAKTKAEAIRQLMEFIRLAEEMGLVIKSNIFVSRIGQTKPSNYGKKKRKRQRSNSGKKH